jgi:hypothetical protein
VFLPQRPFEPVTQGRVEIHLNENRQIQQSNFQGMLQDCLALERKQQPAFGTNCAKRTWLASSGKCACQWTCRSMRSWLPPALIKGYLRLGAKVLGTPAWDPDFNTADLPMLMRLQDFPSRYRRHFLKKPWWLHDHPAAQSGTSNASNSHRMSCPDSSKNG